MCEGKRRKSHRVADIPYRNMRPNKKVIGKEKASMTEKNALPGGTSASKKNFRGKTNNWGGARKENIFTNRGNLARGGKAGLLLKT